MTEEDQAREGMIDLTVATPDDILADETSGVLWENCARSLDLLRRVMVEGAERAAATGDINLTIECAGCGGAFMACIQTLTGVAPHYADAIKRLGEIDIPRRADA